MLTGAGDPDILERVLREVSQFHLFPNGELAASQRALSAGRAALSAAPGDTSAAINAMLSTLGDPALRFLTREQLQGFIPEVSGVDHVGIGLPELLALDIDSRSHDLIVVTPVPGSPAALAGLKPHDVIESVDGVPAARAGLARIASLLREPRNATAVIAVRRGKEQLVVRVMRDSIRLPAPNVSGEIVRVKDATIGYIRIGQFIQSAARDTRAAIVRLATAGADSYVLDLRNNPGGALVEAQQVAGSFVGPRAIARMRVRDSVTSLAGQGEQLTTSPLSVIVNEGTASAAELVASGLQSTARARVVGVRTFGKGLLHALRPLPNGSALVVTTGHLQTLSGKEILREGVLPDTMVSMNASPALQPSLVAAASAKDAQFMEAARLLRPAARFERP